MIPETIRRLFTPKTQGRLTAHKGRHVVSLSMEAALNDLQPGEIMDVVGLTSGREYRLVLREDMDFLLERAGRRAKK